jgi:hypothetical protein
MPKSKQLCPSCCTHTITFTSDNCDYFIELKSEYRKQGRKITIEKLVNKIVSEYRFVKDTKATLI